MPTLASIEAALIQGRRLGRWLDVVGLDAVTQDGTNADLVDPIRHAVAFSGVTLATASTVVSADVSGLGSGDYDKVLDVAELRVLETVRKILPFGFDPSRFTKSGMDLATALKLLDTEIKRMNQRCVDLYGYNLGVATISSLDLSISATNAEIATIIQDNLSEA